MLDPTVVSPAPTNTQDETRSVVKAAGLIGMATFSSRILGFVRDMVLARIFGATPAADAFFVAYRVPNLLRELFAEGSMSSAFIPVFMEYQTLKSKRDAWELASAVFTTLLTIVTGITILGIIVASGIVWVLAPGFHDDPAKLGMTTLLTRIMFPYLVFISLAALAMGILNSLRAFAAPAFSPVFFNIFIIGCALFLSPTMSEPILGVAIGVVAGGAAQFAMQLPGLSLRGMLFGFRFKPSHPGVRRIGALMVPSLLGLSVTQINITVSTILASFFAGGPTYLFYGMRLILHMLKSRTLITDCTESCSSRAMYPKPHDPATSDLAMARPIPELAPVIKIRFMKRGAVRQDKVGHGDVAGKSTLSV